MITIVDYQMGNLRSVQKGFEKVGHRATISSDPDQVALAMDLLALVGYRGPVHTPAEALPHVDRRLVEIARALALAPGCFCWMSRRRD